MLELTSIPFVQAKHYTKGRNKPVQLIVVHDMEAPEGPLTAENVAHYFATTEVQASAHYCVDNNSVVQCVRLEDTAYQCKGANANGIGIEHAGYARQSLAEWLDDYGRAMLELSAQLSAVLCRQFAIEPVRAEFLSGISPTVTKAGFCGHRDVPGHGSHSDPGPNFPFDYYLGRVAFYFEQL
jgi:N-acetyl-anhydromuramyl-L-alanine amidase AmpD